MLPENDSDITSRKFHERLQDIAVKLSHNSLFLTEVDTSSLRTEPGEPGSSTGFSLSEFHDVYQARYGAVRVVLKNLSHMQQNLSQSDAEVLEVVYYHSIDPCPRC